MRDQSQKADAGKTNPLMMYEDLGLALKIVTATMEYGKAKYGQRGGWKQVDILRYQEAEARHYEERMLGGIGATDNESGLLHIAHQIVDGLFQLQTYADKAEGSHPVTGRTLWEYNTPVPVGKEIIPTSPPATGNSKSPKEFLKSLHRDMVVATGEQGFHDAGGLPKRPGAGNSPDPLAY